MKVGDLVRIEGTNEVGIVLRIELVYKDSWESVWIGRPFDVNVLRTNGEIEEWEDDKLEVIS